jgi:hypothetical protein
VDHLEGKNDIFPSIQITYESIVNLVESKYDRVLPTYEIYDVVRMMNNVFKKISKLFTIYGTNLSRTQRYNQQNLSTATETITASHKN